MKIERLTAEQESRLPVVRDQWLKIGLATGPTDRYAANKAIDEVYKCAGLEPPKIRIYRASPLAGAISGVIIKNQSTGQVRDQVSEQVREQLWGQVWEQVPEQLRDQVSEQLREQLWGQVPEQVSGQVWGQVSNACFGAHDASWLSFYDFFKSIGLTCCDKLSGLYSAAREFGWFWCFRNAVIITDRPAFIHRDEQNRLHSTTGPALAYSDGFSVYCVHGVRLPAWIIDERETITVGKIDSENNAEIRRVMIDLYGPDRYLTDSGLKPVHSDDYGELFIKVISDDEPLVMVRVINSTAESDGSFKNYWLRVQPELRPMLSGNRFGEPQTMTARNAVASTFGLVGADYAPFIQT